MAAPTRLIVTGLLLAAIVATPFIIQRLGWVGWIWGAVTALSCLVYVALLLTSYLRIRLTEREAEAAAVLAGLEQRFAGLVEDRSVALRDESREQMRNGFALVSDRAATQTAQTRDQVRALIENQQLTIERLGALDRRMAAGQGQISGLSAVQQSLSGRVADLDDRAVEAGNQIKSLSGRVVDLDDRTVEAGNQIESLRTESRQHQEGLITEATRQHEALAAAIHDIQAMSSAKDTATTARIEDLAGRISSGSGRLGKVEIQQAELSQSLEAINARLPSIQTRIEEFRTLMQDRFGPEFEERLEAWRVRLDNEISDAVQRGRTEDNLAQQEREAALRVELKSLHDAVLKQHLDAQIWKEQAAAEQSGARQDIEQGVSKQITGALEGLASRHDVAAEIERAMSDVGSKAEVKIALGMAMEARDKAEQLAKSAVQAETVSRIEKSVSDVERRGTANAAAMRKLSDSNATIARPFERLLGPDKIQRIEQHWLKAFGINMSRTALAYMAHKICLMEDKGAGRIAAPIETIVMRQLALRSLPHRGKLEVLEIGSLFGLSASVLYNFQGARSSGMNLTLLDPLEGYYEAGGADPVTGIEVNEVVLRKNLADLNVPRTDYRLIKDLSANAEAIRAASDRLYDYVLVDGDHSTAGVAADFENYGPLVKPGGLIIFDDYGSDHWPGIQPYVDEVVRADPNWIWIGADYRTAILAKKADGATASIIAPPKRPRPRKSPATRTPAKSPAKATTAPSRRKKP